MTSKGKVLVIDDDPDFVEFVRIILESNEYDVVCAYNADQGVDMLRAERPGVVLLDMMMSYTMAGLEVTRVMGQDPELSSIPLIVISAVLPGAQALEDQGGSESVAAFLTKPVEPSELVRVIAENITTDPA